MGCTSRGLVLEVETGRALFVGRGWGVCGPVPGSVWRMLWECPYRYGGTAPLPRVSAFVIFAVAQVLLYISILLLTVYHYYRWGLWIGCLYRYRLHKDWFQSGKWKTSVPV
jgi:hypothetical protein